MNDKLSILRNNLATVLSFDKDKINPLSQDINRHRNLDRKELSNVIKDWYFLLEGLSKNIEILISFEDRIIDEINGNLLNAINHYRSQLANNDNIKTEYTSVIDYISRVITQIRTSGIYCNLLLSSSSDVLNDIKENKNLLDEFNSKKNTYIKSISIFDEVMKGRDKFISALINEKGQAYSDMARNYKFIKWNRFFKIKWTGILRYPTGRFLSMGASFIFAGIALCIIFEFLSIIENNGNNISVGMAILRISSVIVPAYFSLYFSQKYSRAQRLYQYYNDKSISLSTLSELYKTYPTHQEKVLDKALDVVFSNFSEGKDNDVSQKDIVGLALEIAKLKK